MAGKFGYNLGNKRNREIFGPNWGKIISIVGVCLLLIILLYALLNEETEEEAGETAQETTEQPEMEKTSVEAAASPADTAIIIGECPLPTIPIVDITEDTLYGDTSRDNLLPRTCNEQIDIVKRKLGKIYTSAKAKERNVNAAEQRLGVTIKELDDAILELYAKRQELEQLRTCSEATTVAVPEVKEEPVAEPGEEAGEEEAEETEEPLANETVQNETNETIA